MPHKPGYHQARIAKFKADPPPSHTERLCQTHGLCKWAWRSTQYVCMQCAVERTSRLRTNRLLKLKQAAGGACVLCGYSRCMKSLHFHHVDATTKLFGVSNKVINRPWVDVIAEVAKCALLCANCHYEVEDGMTDSPSALGLEPFASLL